MKITHFVRRTPRPDSWVGLTPIVLDDDGSHHMGFDSRPISADAVSEATTAGGLVALEQPIKCDGIHGLWIEPDASIWWANDSDPIGDLGRHFVMRDDVVLEEETVE